MPDSFVESGIKVWTKVWRKEGLHSDNKNDLFSKRTKALTFLARIQYHYIPAVKSKEYFRELLSELYSSLLLMEDDNLAITNMEYSSQLQILTASLTERIEELLNIKSAIQLPDNMNQLFRNLSFKTSDEYIDGVNLDFRGDGIKARHIPAIVKYIQNNFDAHRPQNAIVYTHIWGYEEPENGVELAACFDMAKEIYSYKSDAQMLITTHSPAFYALGNNTDARRYFVYKSQEGNSKYSYEMNDEEINKRIGLLDLVAPFIAEEHAKYVQQLEKISLAEDEIRKLKNKIILITEGKTDTRHIKVAFSNLDGLDEGFLSDISYYEFDNADTLGDDLKKLLRNLSHIKNESKIIGLFDRDKLNDDTRADCVEYLGNNVYKAFLPMVDSRFNKGEIKICIEHYYSDSEIKVDTGYGRLYMGNDFDSYGKSKDGMWYYKGWRENTSRTEYQIIDSSNKHICILDDNAKCLSKNEFAKYVERNANLFDFSNFRLLYELLLKIRKGQYER